jgi:hypothetical protein
LGGAIFNQGTLSVYGCTLIGNQGIGGANRLPFDSLGWGRGGVAGSGDAYGNGGPPNGGAVGTGKYAAGMHGGFGGGARVADKVEASGRLTGMAGIARTAQWANFFAGGATLRGGVRLALHDFDGDGAADLAAGSGAGEPSRVRVQKTATLLSGAMATDQDLCHLVRNVQEVAEMLTSPESGPLLAFVSINSRWEHSRGGNLRRASDGPVRPSLPVLPDAGCGPRRSGADSDRQLHDWSATPAPREAVLCNRDHAAVGLLGCASAIKPLALDAVKTHHDPDRAVRRTDSEPVVDGEVPGQRCVIVHSPVQAARERRADGSE